MTQRNRRVFELHITNHSLYFRVDVKAHLGLQAYLLANLEVYGDGEPTTSTIFGFHESPFGKMSMSYSLSLLKHGGCLMQSQLLKELERTFA